MLAWLAPLLVLGLVVFVHELGHFLAAKALGVYAPRFSLGWGKALIRWRRRGSETEYVVSALPIGGYVRMASRLDETAAMLEGGNEAVKEGAAKDPHWDPDAMLPHGPKPIPSDRWFESKPTWARVVILLAGVTMNVVLTLVVSTGVFVTGGRRYVPPVLDTVVVNSAAARAGFQVGDSVVAVDGHAIKTWSDFVGQVSASPFKSLKIDVARGSGRLSLTAVPDSTTVPDPFTGKPTLQGKLGVYVRWREVKEPMSFAEAAASGWRATWLMAGSVVGVLGGLARGTVSVSSLGGPIRIAQTSVVAARSGLESLFTLIAFLSVNLAVLNLLPIPILDGGQILITIAEGVKGGSLSDRTRENLMRVGLAAIAALFVVVMFNDIKALILGIFG